MRFTCSKIIFFIILIALSALYTGGCRRAGTWLVKEDMPPHADAIVLLMGSFPERVLQAADLYNKGKADRLIIVRENMGGYRKLEERGVTIISTTRQAGDAAVSLGVPAASIVYLPGDARSTIDEALAIRDYLSGTNAIDTIILVSSPAHTRRAAMIFRAALRDMNHPVCVGCSPSSYSAYSPEKWWRRREDIQTVLSEYIKAAGFVLLEKRGLQLRGNRRHKRVPD
jgi:uncharacterized SAM-binding protein YcdF (DUF218 family)